ncbi:NAD P-binding protein [Gloeophyllum trabeum ATCC 11539]|uniref:NAD P-binding protein n=1 Tax=Gloeophyllum trabeum (strain ATCC 11539 / FP-39264 / Madison 617) TaxID=670483 RepID=S7RD44_GLOTA|nr:NAD P-binding protein [Gloeophyllum trabeum ATCC 11539]EPQ50349.1 NAD P-binding protein [Gloeophyllum trabeum ATCC 11539]
MPAVAPPSKVLVTGANGYIAIWVVRRLLEKGYAVRGTVRSESKATYLRHLFSTYGDKHEVVVVEDITKEGAFDEAVKGVDAIEHTASPFHLNCDDPNEFIEPAVKGTTGVLQSALKYGSNVKRIVVTSSCAAVLEIPTSPRVFTEKDWNQQALKEVEEKGRDALVMNKYRASKTLAEKAAWEFVEKNKGSIGWDLVVLNPPYVFGPIIHDVPGPDQINTSMAEFYNTLLKGAKDEKTLATLGNCWIDVRDLALAHVLAIETQEAGGNRFIVSQGTFKWQDFVDAAHEAGVYPESALSKGTPGAGYGPGVTHMISYDTSKAAKVLGLDKYISKEQCTKDSLEDFKKRGW